MINKKIPEFKLKAFDSTKSEMFVDITNHALEGKWSVLFFYPADFTFVCPTELEDLAENIDKFKELGVDVYSVSNDTHFSHMAWHDSSPKVGKVKFPMIGDPTARLSKALGIYTHEDGMCYRGTFVVNPEGKIKIVEINDGGIGRSAKELLRKIEAAKFVEENDGYVCPANWDKDKEALKLGNDKVGKL